MEINSVRNTTTLRGEALTRAAKEYRRDSSESLSAGTIVVFLEGQLALANGKAAFALRQRRNSLTLLTAHISRMFSTSEFIL